MRMRSLLGLAALLVLPLALARAQDKPAESPSDAEVKLERNPDAEFPQRQEKGPGSAEYAHKEVEVAEAGEGGKHYWLYTPSEPRPEKAPLVCFLHGYGALKPVPYIGWIHHICRRGNIVVYPQYQEHGLEPPLNYALNCAHAVIEAIKWLKEDKARVQPREADFALVGHSAGGLTTGNLAADWETLKIPRPKAAMPVQPGRSFSYTTDSQKNKGLVPLSEYAKIPETCLLLCAIGDSDTTVGHWCARRIFADATNVKPENKNLVVVRSTTHAAQPAIAHHQCPAAPKGVDDFKDWYGWWKLFDGLCDAAFHGKNREYALGNTPQQRFMGKCSDGRPATEIKVTPGDAKVDADEEYLPAFHRDGTPFKPGDNPRRPRRPAPDEAKPEEKEEG